MTSYIFVCGSALVRSPAAVDVAKEIAKERNLNIQAFYMDITRISNYFRSISRESMPPAPRISEIDHAAGIFFMEEHHMVTLEGLITPLGIPTYCLNVSVPIGTNKDDPILRKTLRQKIEPYLVSNTRGAVQTQRGSL